MRRIRIESDGGAGCLTRIHDADSGELIDGVMEVRWSATSSEELPWAELVIAAPAVNLTVDASVTTRCPRCGNEMEADT